MKVASLVFASACAIVLAAPAPQLDALTGLLGSAGAAGGALDGAQGILGSVGGGNALGKATGGKAAGGGAVPAAGGTGAASGFKPKTGNTPKAAVPESTKPKTNQVSTEAAVIDADTSAFATVTPVPVNQLAVAGNGDASLGGSGQLLGL
ncbi:uncharacterized protein L969DRAFT_46226 [Mixia osmundae IAM 14324]|uniref:Uncharacterized protein n=1 Tax=Mixia osmundae (strain CBS 9802 / IAM 14324 / JCM 22182 / KY 12970) TaxID=764103 RepID=G7DU37_MIXOS|nr:uncharacterized protein L969DRAFT_46226 [Mixia osmundae IAM 14324]KEI40964.1 hypothetical protein L969DRAFT_46226 [Mixia osmundae IAM 14324]GAA94097.1 hypothetical protein E5Q_00744 [Mixia osmundae IAM 14324]